MAFRTITTAKKNALNKMNMSACSNGLGDLLANNICYAALYTTVGGSATEAITITGLAVGDIPNVTVNTNGATPRTITTAKVTSNTLTVVFSGDPAADHVINIVVHRVV